MIKIYGCSDDLIEVEGDINEEFYLDRELGFNYLALSDGTVLHIEYSAAGVWRITPISYPISYDINCDRDLEIIPYWTKGDFFEEYSDIAIIYNHIRWIVNGRELIKNDN